MTYSDLDKDRSLRKRLILVCLVLALSVSAVYVVVSFRLSFDLGSEAELRAARTQANMIMSEVLEHEDGLADRFKVLVHDLQRGNDVDSVTPMFIQVRGNDITLSDSHDIPATMADRLGNLDKVLPDHGRIDKIGMDWYVCLQQSKDGYLLTYVKKLNALEETLSHTIKRLGFTSLIVFWLAIWGALTLSSWLAKRVEEKNETLTHLASHDLLTNLPNRLFLLKKLNKLPPEQVAKTCLLVIGLERHRDITESLGIQVGDRILLEVADRMRKELAPGECLSRLGEDEFVVMLQTDCTDYAENKAQAIIRAVEAPVVVNRLNLTVVAKVGIITGLSQVESSSDWLKFGFQALNRAKSGQQGWFFYDGEGQEEQVRQLTLISELATALTEEQIELYYQPKVNLETGKMVGVEALARWNHPKHGLLMPGHFMPLVDQSGLVQEFGRYVLKSAIRQLGIWHKQKLAISVAVNLSPFNLLDPGLKDYIEEQLNLAEVPASLLELELTETATSMDVTNIAEYFRTLKTLGVELSIDDFGTGMSSLAYLGKLNVDTIKIDRSFICDIDTNPQNQAIVHATLALCHSLGCQSVAEGIETDAQRTMLLSMGCDIGQGYYFSRPVPVVELEKLARNSSLISG